MHRYISGDPRRFLTDALAGVVAAHDHIAWEPDPGFLYRTDREGDGVALVSGGGSGHEPMHSGLIGAGMLDAACPGLVFTSPNALQVAAATRHVDRGAGVLHIVKNYTGDVMNFRVARRLVDGEVETDHVLIDDDVATGSSSDDNDGPGRRGTGATVIVEKICGAAAARGDDLASVADLGRRVASGARSFSVAFAPCTVPGADRTSFDLAPDEMEYGVGIHGESGVDRIPQQPVDELVSGMLGRILDALAPEDGEPLIVFVNGLGSTHPLELGVVFDQVVRQLTARGFEVRRSLVATLVTALDMAGFSLTVVRCDDEIVELFDAPTGAPGWPARTATSASHPVDVSFAEPDDSAAEGPECGWLSAFVERVQGSIEELTDLDRRAGDGDFGTNMVAALDHLDLPLRGTEAAVARALSTSFLVRAGGTSGAVFGTLFAELATAADESDGSGALADGVASALGEITDLGGARVGDNTLVDALAPASDALAAGASLDDVAAAAEAGAESTRDLVASRGRASYVGDRARGVVDPGALVIAWLFRAAADHR
ncbi:dihydroxyacetone kinase family protein [Williamsia sp. MIQD14]|uniref:dihydroxyacetone kinase family protein n=1 Tax=Williamsia sp. MIQD14 TaxID=3425703 RepID=UPI003DA03CEC